jgi:hypothetical protein
MGVHQSGVGEEPLAPRVEVLGQVTQAQVMELVVGVH